MHDLPGLPSDHSDLQLAPGLRVVARGRDHLQVGLYAGRRTLLPRTEAVERTLEALIARRGVDPDPETAPVLDRLARHGYLVPRAERIDRERRRRQGRVALLGSLAGVDVTELFTRAAVEAVATAGPAGPAGDAVERADVVLVLSTGEIARERLDPLVRRGTSHLVVRLVDGAAMVGPFVVPGLTACLRCIDGHRSVHDPDHVVVTSRYVRASSRARPDGMPDLDDPLLATVAAAWAVRDVVAHLEGRRPSTWSRTLLLDAEPSSSNAEDWSRHPQCGCSWPTTDRLSGTMEA